MLVACVRVWTLARPIRWVWNGIPTVVQYLEKQDENTTQPQPHPMRLWHAHLD